MQHVPRTHRVDLDFLFERLREDPGIFIRHVGTKQQMADIFTKGNFTAETWQSLCTLAQIGPPSKLTICHPAAASTTIQPCQETLPGLAAQLFADSERWPPAMKTQWRANNNTTSTTNDEQQRQPRAPRMLAGVSSSNTCAGVSSSIPCLLERLLIECSGGNNLETPQPHHTQIPTSAASTHHTTNIPIRAWHYEMEGHAEQCVDRYLELTNKTKDTLTEVSTPCMDDHQFRPEEMVTKGEVASVAARIVLKCLYVARVGRPDILWSVNYLARMVTKGTTACDKRLHKFISYIHHTTHWTQVCYVGDHPWECWLALFVDANFAGDLVDSKSTSGSYLCLVGPHTFVPISWMCKKQGAVSHSSSEAEVIALDAATRLEGIPALLLWEVALQVFPPTTNPSTSNK
jgi:hypothetical protein